MPKVFLSYRRGDSQDVTGRIFDRLKDRCGRDNVFKDVDSIPAGADFRKVLSHEVGLCDIVIVVIGEQWLLSKDGAGQRRIDGSGDFVRIEIESALARGIPVIPVLVGVAEMPNEEELPMSIGPLAFRQGLRVRPDPDFHRDVDRLCEAVDPLGAVRTSEVTPSASLSERNRPTTSAELRSQKLTPIRLPSDFRRLALADPGISPEFRSLLEAEPSVAPHRGLGEGEAPNSASTPASSLHTQAPPLSWPATTQAADAVLHGPPLQGQSSFENPDLLAKESKAAGDDCVPTPADLLAARAAVNAKATDGAACRRLHEACRERAVPAVLAALNDCSDDDSRSVALNLLGVMMRQPDGRRFVSAGIRAAVEGGVLHKWNPHLHWAGLEVVVGAPIPNQDKWRFLTAAMAAASERSVSVILDRLPGVTPPDERLRTGAAVIETLRFATEDGTVSAACRAIVALGYRDAVPDLIGILPEMTRFSHHVAAVLAQWRAADAVPAIRESVERYRYGADGYSLGGLLLSLSALEGSQCSSYVAEVVLSSAPATHVQLLNQLAGHGKWDDVVAEAVRQLGNDSGDSYVQKKASEIAARNT